MSELVKEDHRAVKVAREKCHCCGAAVHAEYDEDGTPVVYRAIHQAPEDWEEE